MEKAIFCWSSGKDSAMALYEMMKGGSYEVECLLTTVTEGYDRVSMHGVRRELVEAQAAALGLPLEKIFISQKSSDSEYDMKMRRFLETKAARGIRHVAFGDIFLEDLKKYRMEKLSRVNMAGLFPLWKRDTAELAGTFISLGFRAVVTCVDTKVLDKSFAGRMYDEAFLADLPEGIDPCGENGEFHSFCHDGPIFSAPIRFAEGESVLRDNRFQYRDVRLVSSP
ncbi:MAG: diphthine--ammonia ligase [Candidatus Omnitrophica bacterium]|nr:diphthine--ammonia ligase [Candidatus Omnitrophota bacterium]